MTRLTEVPRESWLLIVSLPLSFSARSRMPAMPQWPSFRRNSMYYSLTPMPLSWIEIFSPRFAYRTTTRMAFA